MGGPTHRDWRFTKHGSRGTNYPNESTFATIESGRKVVIRHIVEPANEQNLDRWQAEVAGAAAA